MKYALSLLWALLPYFLSGQPFTDVVKLNHSLPLSAESSGFEPWTNLNINAGAQVIGPHYLLVNYVGSRQAIVSDFYESADHPAVHMNALALGGYILPPGKPWRLQALGRLQYNGQYAEGTWPQLQPGGLLVYQRSFSENFLAGIGGYYARQLFGDFWIPIVDVQWQINPKLHLNLRVPQRGELRWTLADKKWVTGAWFFSVIQSYDPIPDLADHLRTEEIYAGAFVEFMPIPSLVLRLEPTYIMLQRFLWQDADAMPVFEEERPGSFYLRFGVHYRVWRN